jgi:peptide-methionine (S)-S-oxide reductase
MSSMRTRRPPGSVDRGHPTRAAPWAFAVLAALLIALAPYAAAATSAGDGDAKAAEPELASAIFAGGCFWCMEPPFDKLEGVVSTTSGYTGGRLAAPTYAQVSAGGTGHFEAIRVVYDPNRIDYQTLLNVFWRNVDPLDAGGQFCDRGDQYRSAIFYETEAQKRLAERSKAELEGPKGFGRAVATPILPASSFYDAEDYHQDYYQKNPLRYNYYRFNCGRDRRLDKLWGDADAAAARKN